MLSVSFIININQFIFTGFSHEADHLLSKFKWGHSFFTLNQDFLESYAACSSAQEVVDVQQRIIADIETANRKDRQTGTSTWYCFELVDV